MKTVVSSTGLRPAYQRPSVRLNAGSRTMESSPPRFQGQNKAPKSAPQEKTVMETLFGNPSKNMMWSLGYSVGGVMLTPMTPLAIGAFCLAAVHLVSASYQFLTQKPPEPTSAPKEAPKKGGPKFAGKRLSVSA